MDTVTGTLMLVATLGGQPAFQDVEWDMPNLKPRHSQVVHIPAEEYNICGKLRFTSKQKCGKVVVREAERELLIISMD